MEIKVHNDGLMMLHVELAKTNKQMDKMETDVVCTDAPTIISFVDHTVSPEVFIPNDNIIHTQESVELEKDPEIKGSDINDATKQDDQRVMDKDGDQVMQVQERRSERLKKDAMLITMEKTEKVAKKRNLEGNSKKSNSFSVLANDDIMHISSEMGIVIEDDGFDTCNLLNVLETAKLCLC